MTKTHSLSAAYFSLVFISSKIALNFFPVKPYIFIGASIIAATFPDIDIPTSKIGRLFYPISKFINKFFGHRTITHSLLGCCIFSFGIYKLLHIFNFNPYIYVNFLYGALFGYIIHILGDILTNKGVQLFYPFKRRVRFPITFPTGGSAEWFLIGVMIVGIFVSIVNY